MKRTMRKLAVLIALASVSAFAVATDKAPKKGYLTDSANDVVKSGFGLCWHTGFWTPADAIEEARRIAHWVTHKPGGRGAVREAVDLLLKAQGHWERLVEKFAS